MILEKNWDNFGILLSNNCMILRGLVFAVQSAYRGTNFATSCLILKSSLIILCTYWILCHTRSSTTSSMVWCRSFNIILWTFLRFYRFAPFKGVQCEMERLSIFHHFWNGKTIQILGFFLKHNPFKPFLRFCARFPEQEAKLNGCALFTRISNYKNDKYVKQLLEKKSHQLNTSSYSDASWHKDYWEELLNAPTDKNVVLRLLRPSHQFVFFWVHSRIHSVSYKFWDVSKSNSSNVIVMKFWEV